MKVVISDSRILEIPGKIPRFDTIPNCVRSLDLEGAGTQKIQPAHAVRGYCHINIDWCITFVT